MENRRIFFITGASGTGKTTLVSEIRDKYRSEKSWEFLHFDTIGVPRPEEMAEHFGSRENWQKETTFSWIKKLVMGFKDKEIIIFEGQVNLQFIREGFLHYGFSDYEIILLDCRESVMEKRLTKDRNQPELVSQDMKNWLSFLRKQGMSFGVKIIDTSFKTRSEMLKSFEEILGGWHNQT